MATYPDDPTIDRSPASHVHAGQARAYMTGSHVHDMCDVYIYIYTHTYKLSVRSHLVGEVLFRVCMYYGYCFLCWTPASELPKSDQAVDGVGSQYVR